MPRLHCGGCHYPIKTCVCQAISTLDCGVQVIILQHPTETKHAKNTARLVQLAITETELVTGESPEDFAPLLARLKDRKNVAVFYPAASSAVFDSNSDQQPIDTMVFIDGTWRKALKLWQLNPWLWTMPVFRLNPPKPSDYNIRKTRQPASLSTLEAVSLALTLYNGTNTGPLLNLQQAMQQHWPDFGGRKEK